MIKFQKKSIVFNLDDFSEEIMTTELWKNILNLKKIQPNLKITMFTVPLLCSEKWLKMIKKDYKWMELHYHGSNHKNREEWLDNTNINLPYEKYFYKGFKAPWWRMNQKTADVFNKRGFILSSLKDFFNITGEKVYYLNIGEEIIKDVAYNNPYYISIHSHVQHQRWNNGLPDIFDEITKVLYKCQNFLFISELFS